MRTREEIERNAPTSLTSRTSSDRLRELSLEVLLDIRDLLDGQREDQSGDGFKPSDTDAIHLTVDQADYPEYGAYGATPVTHTARSVEEIVAEIDRELSLTQRELDQNPTLTPYSVAKIKGRRASLLNLLTFIRGAGCR